MDQVIPGLWIGDLPSALDAPSLRANGVYSILSAMRGKITINETFVRHQIMVDDSESTDILTHFIPSIRFIQSELEKGRGVLVHCQAGISRSATIVAAFLMYTQNIEPQAALDLIRNARPIIDPNPGFMQQLELFHKSTYKISRREKAVRMFYLERAVEEIMNGDGSLPSTDMFAKFPRTPSDSLPATPGGARRRIRCKMCRQELATREHMLDHGQLGPATPAVLSPAVSRRPSSNKPRSGSHGSFTQSLGGFGDSLSMSSIKDNPICEDVSEHEDSNDEPSMKATSGPSDPTISNTSAVEEASIDASLGLGQTLSNSITTPPIASSSSDREKLDSVARISNAQSSGTQRASLPPTQLISPSELTSQLLSNPKLAALRSQSFSQGGDANSSSESSNSIPGLPSFSSPPILINPKCSGYFVEPMKWMEPFLSSGQLAGKIICPNKKCGAKLGNFDWAGVCCGCKEWVTPLHLVVTILMWIVAAFHLGLSLHRLLRVYILELENPGPRVFIRLLDPSGWDTLTHMCLVAIMVWLADILVVYRTYIVWNRNLWVIALPLLLDCGNLIVNIMGMYWYTHPEVRSIEDAMPLYLTIYPLVFAQNVLTTGLLSYKIWAQHYESVAHGLEKTEGSHTLGYVARIMTEAALVYTVELLVVIILTSIGHPASPMVVLLTVPSIGIVFVLMAVRIHFGGTNSSVAKGGTVSNIPNWMRSSGGDIELARTASGATTGRVDLTFRTYPDCKTPLEDHQDAFPANSFARKASVVAAP
ncbi:hypothetical protein CVT24_000732 [Panaeolus cyanescens]|uniref:protein-tyrosine-phosphatase n=1 Tax=Panaeolus cyanescens TaxID=181874 RepID=A0A409YCT3_9AGAR|nr:hypothetical protein CVT24_000732 [Panaeolus cyanescens]